MENELLLIKFHASLNETKKKELKNLPKFEIIFPPLWEKILKFFSEATSGIFEEQMCNMQVCI